MVANRHAPNRAAEQAFKQFCSSRGIVPDAREHQRQYWIIGDAERLIAETCEEAEIVADQRLDETTRQRLVAARIGQGKFREDVSDLWERKCALTGCVTLELLRASHIKPWASSDNRERLDPLNGLLLAAHVDALFDRGLISFEDDGSLLYSSQIAKSDKIALSLPGKLRRRIGGQEAYLKVHRETIFRRDR